MPTDLASSNVPLTELQFPAPAFPVYRFSVDEYLQMADSGILSQANVELLDGIIVPKMTRNSWHDAVLGMLQLRLITLLLGKPYTVRVQSALVATTSVPEPDLAIVRGSHSDYLRSRPQGKNAELVIEVSDSTLKFDRQKAAIYASAGVPVYWIINGNDQWVEVFERPVSDTAGNFAYDSKKIFQGDSELQLLLDGALLATFTADQLVPEPPADLSRTVPT